MKILFLGHKESPLIEFLIGEWEEVIVYEDKVDIDFITSRSIEFIISYGYRHIIKKEIIELLPNRVINLHISYLPYNRGADPNFWSFINHTPKGVTIHYIDEGIDTGEIIIQAEIRLSEYDTFRQTYSILQEAIQNLFKKNWISIKEGSIGSCKQEGKGSQHKAADKMSYLLRIQDTWLDIPINDLLERFGEMQMSQQFIEKYDQEIQDIREGKFE